MASFAESITTTESRRPYDAHLFVIDDEVANVRLLERILEQAGFERVSSFTDPRMALEAFDRERPDLIALDLLMPHVDGFKMMEEIASRLELEEYLPVLVLTADATPDTKQRALALGANDFLTKPFDALEVALRIRNLLRTRFLYLDLQHHNEGLEERVRERTREVESSLVALRQTDAARRLVLAKLIDAQEGERRRIAADVHDDSVQMMAAAVIRLHLLRTSIIDPDQAKQLERLEHAMEAATARLRFLLFELHPPSLDTTGLGAALQSFIRLGAPEGNHWFDVHDAIKVPPDEATRITLYRIAQEALTNARKHADAREIKVELSQRDDGYVVRVADDGRGFEVDDSSTGPGHLGLLSLRERADMAGGWCRFSSEPGAGTVVEAWIPAGPGA